MSDITIPGVLEHLAQGKALSDDQADFMFGQFMDGELDPAQAGAFLMGLRCKGEDSTDLAAGVRAGLGHATPIPGLGGKAPFPMIDTCGTGGDGSCSFNCSTTVALFLADMGHKVVKHGNRALSSTCGSADVLEALGVPLDTPPDKVMESLEKFNFVFLFAPAYHPAFKHIMPVRKALGIRTLFNFMGPLMNPARPTHQIVGVGDPTKLHLMGETLLLTGVKKAMIFHGAGDFDELTPFGPARGYLITDGRMDKAAINPESLGFPLHKKEDVRVASLQQATDAVRSVLAGNGPAAMADMAALNLAAALSLLEGLSMEEASEKARAKVAEGIKGDLPHA